MIERELARLSDVVGAEEAARLREIDRQTELLAAKRRRRGGWPGPRKVQKVVPQHPDQVTRVQAYADAEGINYAEAMRRLVDAGLSRPGALPEEDE